MSNQPENEIQTPQQLRQALVRELEASQQAIAELGKVSQEAITGLIEELEEFQRLKEHLEQFSRSFVTEQSRCQQLESSTFPQLDPSANPFSRRKKQDALRPASK